MKQTFLNDPQDCAWLRETHLADNLNNGPVPPFQSFCLFGNEDCPQTLLLYREREPVLHDEPTRFDLCENGRYSSTNLPWLALSRWLDQCGCKNIWACIVTINGESWTACHYERQLTYSADMMACTRGDKKPGDTYTDAAVYCIGKLPSCYMPQRTARQRKAKRTFRVAFPHDDGLLHGSRQCKATGWQRWAPFTMLHFSDGSARYFPEGSIAEGIAAARALGADTTAFERAQADGMARLAYPPKPELAELYQSGYGYAKPVSLGEWQWSTTFGRWGRIVTFADGWHGLSWPKT